MKEGQGKYNGVSQDASKAGSLGLPYIRKRREGLLLPRQSQKRTTINSFTSSDNSN